MELLRPALRLGHIVSVDSELEYRIEKRMPPPVKPRQEGKLKLARHAKSLYLTTGCKDYDWTYRLDKIHEFLSRGWKVQLHLRPKVGNDVWKSVDWALQSCISLQPDTLLASMPNGTVMLANLVSEGI